MHEVDYHADTTRLEALSDGVFAIAMTLLIIEIGVPHPVAGEGLGEALLELWPSYFGYAVSFTTIGVMWANHHQMFKDIYRTDHVLTVLNLLWLLCIAFIPFPTAVLAEYMRQQDQMLEAVLLFGATFTITAIAANALWLWVATHRNLIDDHVSEVRIRSRTRRYLPGPLLYAAGLPLAFVTPWISVGLYGALALFYLLPLNDATS
ncbi:MAG: DUF1211 domain-containing protein [Chloroflexi bacterium]|nr:DUF1211 domain-containing protein [Chloroflexota bacterium]